MAEMKQVGELEIAEDVGYGSEAALSRAFKKIVGVAPATWRATRMAAPVRPVSRS